jgi:glycosyltransferase involved in cell wall biosynthesis
VITLAANNPTMGGGEVMLVEIGAALIALGHEVTLVAPSEPDEVVRASLARGIPTVALQASGRLPYMRALRAFDARRQGVLWCGGLVPGLATAGHRDRVLNLHLQPAGVNVAALAVARPGTRAVVVPSHTLAQGIRGALVLPNWVPRVNPASHLPFGRPVRLGFIGRHSSAKGLVVLADALRILDRDDPGGFRLSLAGDGRFVAEADRLAVEAALAPVYHLIDRLGWSEREPFFAGIDLAVLPSVWPESFGLVVGEAMSARCPFVISGAGAFPEVAGPHHPFVAAPGDAADLARTIVRSVTGYDAATLDASETRWRENYAPEAGTAALAALLSNLRLDEEAR